MSEVQRRIEPTKSELADAIAARLGEATATAVASRGVAHLVLTGGSMGTAVLEALGRRSADAAPIPWSDVHLWWGDERFLPAGDSERNATQAFDALLGSLDLADDHVHIMAASDEGLSLAKAAERYADDLAHAAGAGEQSPVFDVVMLGMGPDTHVASLFPGHAQTRVETDAVTWVDDSPKPPPERLTMTFPTLRRSREVWLMIAGADKADAVRAASASHDRAKHPASAAQGRDATIWWLDEAAAG